MSILASIAALIMGFVLGLLGGGGSILSLPILVYLVGVETKSAIATSLVVVGVTALIGLVSHARSGNVAWRVGAIFGGFAMLGAYGGGWLASFVPGPILLALFAVLMVVTALGMARPAANDDSEPANHKVSALWKIGAEGIVVGGVTGLVGAGGGFLVVPALVLLGGLPMRKAIGTSLLVIAMKSAAGVGGHLEHAVVDWTLTGIFTALAVSGSFLGALASRRVDAARLRMAFAWLVLAMGVALLLAETDLTVAARLGVGVSAVAVMGAWMQGIRPSSFHVGARRIAVRELQ